MPDEGFGLVLGAFSSQEVARWLTLLPPLDESAGTRNLLDFDWCQDLADDPRLFGLAQILVGQSARPVRAILFDKVAGRNWALGWHQDTKIAIRPTQLRPDGYSGWSAKEGIAHVQPPQNILENMVALRIHLDPCPLDNGPLEVLSGSHVQGVRKRPSPQEVEQAHVLAVGPGDVIWMRSLLFHRSAKATEPRHRRVIHIEYCSALLAPGLAWAW